MFIINTWIICFFSFVPAITDQFQNHNIKLLSIYEPPCDETNNVVVRPVKTQISLGIRPVWSEPSLCTQWVAKGPSFLHADSEDSDQTGQMPRLIRVFAGRTATLFNLQSDYSKFFGFLGIFTVTSPALIFTDCGVSLLFMFSKRTSFVFSSISHSSKISGFLQKKSMYIILTIIWRKEDSKHFVFL